MAVSVQPGDVLVIADRNFTSRFIRLQAWLLRKPSGHNHVAIFSHIDAGGTAWVIEGRPSGVGWALAKTYLEHPATLTNADQPKTDEQRRLIVEGAKGMLGVRYDWAAIAELGAEPFRINALWRKYREWCESDTPPVAVICSSYADWWYEHVGLANPGGNAETRFTDVADWAGWLARRGWQS